MIRYDTKCAELGDEAWIGQCLGHGPTDAAIRYMEARDGELSGTELDVGIFCVEVRESVASLPLAEVRLRYTEGGWAPDVEL